MRKTDTKANPKSCAANKLVPGVNDLATTNPEVAAEWDYEKNGDLLPSQIAQFSNKSVWWKCKAHGHSWKTQVATRTRGKGCPVCAGKIILPGFNDLASAEPEIAAQWDYEKNGTLTPGQVARYSMKKVWWRCEKGHSYLQLIASRTSLHQGCPYCSGAKVLRGFNDLCTTHPEIAADWNYEKNGALKPWEVSHGSPKKVWWKCKNGHEYFDSPNHRTSPYSNRACPYCSGKKVLVGFNDMATTSPEMAAAWNYEKNGDLKPTDVTDCSGKIVWWKCENGHEYRQKISNKKSQHQGCPQCQKEARTSFPEQAVFYYIKLHFPDAKNGYRSTDVSEYDIFIPSKRIAIEYDGEYYHKSQISKAREQRKDRVSKEIGVTLYRIKENTDYFDIAPFSVNNLTIEYNPQNNESFNQVIEYLLSLMGIKETVNVETNRQKIYKQYISLKKANSLQVKNPEAVLDWDWEKNSGLSPENISYCSGKKVHWKCHICGEEWVAPISYRAHDKGGCVKCRKKIKQADFNNALLKQYGSFKEQYPTLAAEWDYEKNGDERPEQYTCGSSKPFWWKCSKCGYSWQTSIMKRIDSRCPNCGASDEQLALDGWVQ